MRFISGRASVALVAGLLSSAAFANSSGINGFSGKSGATCTSCHLAGAAVPTVQLSGPATLAAGETGQYTVTIKGGPGKLAGTDIAVSDAAAKLVEGTGLKLLSGELTHTMPKAFANGEASFTFSLKAPSTGGTVTLYAAGNSANADYNNTGDGIGSTKLDVTVTGAAPVAEEEKGGCAATGGAPVWMFALLAAGVGLRRVRVAGR
jgi:uncharacterized protein (TIGR03382 family)